ncbi:MAG TPA: isoprenylcysteine carboxylmethyltransferase family protein [Armatimonadota bacterium]|jgi:protein-S-isoprenylcysteine O-methyltransferase Ste14
MYRQLAKHRLVYSYVIALLTIVFAHRPPIYWGLILIAAGMAVRFWAAGHIQKNDEVSKTGPYAFTRNPLYLGTFLGALGACVLGHEFILMAVMVITFALFYGSTIASEEEYLSSHYGDDYTEYKKHVPVFLPRLTPYKTDSQSTYSWARALKNREHKYSGTTILIPILIILVAYLRH